MYCPKSCLTCIQRRYTEIVTPGCVVGGENVNNLRYADDTALIAESEEKLQALVDNVRGK